jgi:hypothetical protein
VVELSVDVLAARAEPYSSGPTITWTLRLAEHSGAQVHALALHAQVRIEPGKRRYDVDEQDRLVTLFGSPHQWGGSLHPFLWATLDTVVPGFENETEVELQMACTYDFEVAGSRYLHALRAGDVPVALLFSGTVFHRGEAGFTVEPVPWHLDATYRLPVSVWREVIDQHFPGEGWLRLSRPTIDRLDRYRTAQVLPTWDETVAALLTAAGEEP